MTLLRPRSIGFFLLLLACASGSAWFVWMQSKPSVRFERVLLISLDTVRADHLGCYGRSDAHTPNLDALADRGASFAACTTAAPTTLASHTSIFTGAYPHMHGVARNGFLVSPDNVLLAEWLREAGFETAAFLGSFALDRRFGIDQGFEHYDQTFDVGIDASHEQEQRRATQVTDAVLAWVAREDPGRSFLFVHYFDAHAPYEPPPPFHALFTREDGPRKASLEDMDRAARAQQARTTKKELGLTRAIVHGLDNALLDAADGVHAVADKDLAALYAGEIAYLDQEVGRLLDGLGQRGFLDDALVIVVADHGETLAEHGDYWNHGSWTYDTTAHVPLIVAATGPYASAVRPGTVEEPVSTVDVFPTLCDLLGLRPPATVQGTSLVPWIAGTDARRGPVFCEATQPVGVEQPRSNATPWENAQKPKCVRIGDCKLIRAPYLAREELYDLAADPAERHDLLRPGAASGACDLSALRMALDSWSASARPRASRFDPAQTLETRQKLGGLGYDEGGGAADGTEPGPR